MHHSIIKAAMIKSIVLGFIFLSGFRMEGKAGGIVFEIYLNNKLLVKQAYNKIISGSPDLQLTAANYDDNLRLVLSSCGSTTVTRSLGIKNEKNELIKKWDFSSTLSELTMTIPVKEILNLQKGKPAPSLRLFYLSPDIFANGYMLASVLPAKKDVAYLSNSAGKFWPAYTAGVFVLGALGWMVHRKA